MILPDRCADHELAGLVGEFKGGGQVHGHHGIPLVAAELLHVGQQGDAGAVDQDVDRAQRLDAAVNDGRRDAWLA